MTVYAAQSIQEPNFEAIPQELRIHPKWMLWKLEPTKKDSNILGKVPYQVNGYRGSKNNHEHYLTFEEVKAAYKRGGFDGVGMVFNRNDSLVCVDLDDFKDIKNIPAEKYNLMLHSYTEYSPSEKGLHIWIKGQKPESCRTKKNGVELYGSELNSFVTVTGNVFTNLPVNENQLLINKIVDRYFKEDKPQEKPEKRSVAAAYKELPDEIVLNNMFASKHGKKIEGLFRGSLVGHASHSEADLALCNHLAYWTNNNPGQMDRLFRNSALIRDKWDEKRGIATYGYITIEKAIAGNEINGSTKEDPEKVEKVNWWTENPNGTQSLRHAVLAEYIIEKYHIVHYPDVQGNLYFYNVELGIYELDKTGRCIRSFIRQEHEFKMNQIKETIEYIVDMSPIQKEISQHYIAVNNGLLHMETMEFKEFTPDEFIISKIPTNYNPHAFDPFIDDTLKRVTDGFEPSIRNIEEMFGCVLYPKLLVTKMFYLYGRSSHNGKSSLLYMIHKAFNYHGGNISAISPQKLATNSFAGASMYGKVANIVDDLPDQLIEDAGSLKTVITGGYLEIERKGIDSETVEIVTTLITASNYYPNFREHGKQINRRLHIIPFDHDFSQDEECLNEIETNRRLSSDSAREHVLRLAVDALKRMLASTSTERLTPNTKAEEAKQDFAEHNNPLTEFFVEYDKSYFEDNIGTVTYGEYQCWCDNHYISHPLGLKKFKEAVMLQYNMTWKDKKVKSRENEWKTVKGFVSK